MKRTVFFAFAVALSLGLYGCGSPSGSESAGQSSPPAASDGQAEHAEHDHGANTNESGDALTDMEKMRVELAKLSPEDAASAEKQHVCPVSGEMLGTMGAPIRVDVNGQQVWICCQGCRKPLLENPDEHLAKLSQ